MSLTDPVTDPVTVGVLAASALAMAAESGWKSVVGETAKDAYKALKTAVSRWSSHDVTALEQAPGSPGRRAVLAEVIDGRPEEDKTLIRTLAEALVAEMRRRPPVGFDFGRLEALDADFSGLTVTEGIGARIEEVNLKGTFRAPNVSVGTGDSKETGDSKKN